MQLPGDTESNTCFTHPRKPMSLSTRPFVQPGDDDSKWLV